MQSHLLLCSHCLLSLLNVHPQGKTPSLQAIHACYTWRSRSDKQGTFYARAACSIQKRSFTSTFGSKFLSSFICGNTYTIYSSQGYQVLHDNGNAMDAVTAAVTVMEGSMVRQLHQWTLDLSCFALRYPSVQPC